MQELRIIGEGNMVVAALNGFGRFGLGLFESWFFDTSSHYEIGFIHDPVLTAHDIIDILRHDAIVRSFADLDMSVENHEIFVDSKGRPSTKIKCTTGMLETARWLGKVDVLFECSGRTENQNFLDQAVNGRTLVALVGATIKNSDTELIYGLNHTEYNSDIHKIVSFGSCTVIPGTHVVSAIQKRFGLETCLINILHSVPKWQLDEGRWKSLQRKTCSLETVGTRLLKLTKGELKVNYTYAPYWGVSLMDFYFEVTEKVSREDVVQYLSDKSLQDDWKGIIDVMKADPGGEAFQSSKASICLILDEVDVREERVHFFGYFNNEGSGVRLHDLCGFILQDHNL